MEELREELPVGLAVWVPLGCGTWWPARITCVLGDERVVRHFPTTDIGYAERHAGRATVTAWACREYVRYIALANQTSAVFAACVEANIWVRTHGLAAQRAAVGVPRFLAGAVVGRPGSPAAVAAVAHILRDLLA